MPPPLIFIIEIVVYILVHLVTWMVKILKNITYFLEDEFLITNYLLEYVWCCGIKEKLDSTTYTGR